MTTNRTAKPLFRSISIFHAVTCVMAATLLPSCGDDTFDIPATGEAITFSVTTSGVWSDMTTRGRAPEGAAKPRHDIYVIEGECGGMPQPVYLHATDEDWTDPDPGTEVNTRATDSGDDATLKSIAVTSYVTQNGKRQLYSKEERLSSSNGWQSSMFWPSGDSSMDFYAYGFIGCQAAPDYMTFTAADPSSDASTAPSISFSTMKSDNKTETGADLLVGKCEKISASAQPVVDMTMYHALTKIELEAGENFTAGTITAVGFRNVHTTGVYDFSADSGTGDNTDTRTDTGTGMVWLPRDEPNGEFRREFTEGIKTDGQSRVSLISGDEAFIMMPQSFGADSEAELYVVFTEAVTGLEIELTFPMTGREWGQGKHLRYSLSTNPNMVQSFLEIDRDEFKFDYRGRAIVGSKYNGDTDKWEDILEDQWTANIKSYYAVTSANNAIKYTPLELDTESILESCREDWLTVEIERIPSATNMAEYKMTLKCEAQEGIEEGSGEISDKTPLGTEAEPYDLSTMGGTEACTTANCYIVNAPGWYSIPLVYGNAIKDGNKRSLSYIRTEVAGGNSLGTLLNYLGNKITSSYIYEDCSSQISNAQCVLLWQDGAHLTDTYYIDQEKKNIIFHVSGSNQGNFVLGLKDTKRNWVMWSWHIWLTDYSSTDDLFIPHSDALTLGPDNVGSDYVFMSKNIGWCDGYSIGFSDRNAIKYIQTDQFKNVTQKISFKVEQIGHTAVTIGSNTFYQWGRKDPIPGIAIDEGGDVKLRRTFSHSCPIEFMTPLEPNSNDNTIQAAIRFPTKFYFFVNNSWTYEEIPCNLWAINQADYTGTHNLYTCVKTIYDPSPRGYKIPDNRVFHHLFHEQSKYSWLVCSEEAHPNSNYESFSLPLSGILDDISATPMLYWNDPSDNISKRVGRYWTARSQSTTTSSHVCIKFWESTSSINFHSEGCGICTGMSIRAMKDI